MNCPLSPITGRGSGWVQESGTMKYQKHLSLRFGCALLCLVGIARGAAEPVDLHWLDGAPPFTPGGVSFGVPWPKAQVQKNQTFTLTRADGKALPLQSWITGYWPDGSVKWIGVATVAGPEATSLKIAPAPTSSAGSALKVTQSGGTIQIDTGKLKAVIPTQGENLI